MKYFIDSSAWIEYLEGSEMGEKVAQLIKGKNEIFTLPINIGEVISKIKKKKGNVELTYHALISSAKISQITPRQAKEAGILHSKHKEKNKSFSLADAFIITVAKELNAILIAKDPHFKEFTDTIIL